VKRGFPCIPRQLSEEPILNQIELWEERGGRERKDLFKEPAWSMGVNTPQKRRTLKCSSKVKSKGGRLSTWWGEEESSRFVESTKVGIIDKKGEISQKGEGIPGALWREGEGRNKWYLTIQEWNLIVKSDTGRTCFMKQK